MADQAGETTRLRVQGGDDASNITSGSIGGDDTGADAMEEDDQRDCGEGDSGSEEGDDDEEGFNDIDNSESRPSSPVVSEKDGAEINPESVAASSSLSLDLPAAGSSAPNSGAPTPSAQLLVPFLKGVLSEEGVCKGSWAMSQTAYDQPGNTSDFEFKLVTPDCEADGSLAYPINGTYEGWFDLKQPKGSLRVVDRDMTVVFTRTEGGQYEVSGKGVNQFGSFSLSGLLTPDTKVAELYREYTNLTPVSSASALKRRQSFGDDHRESKRKVSSNSKAVEFKDGTALPTETPREGSGRVRRMSSLLREYEETAAQKVTTPRQPKKEPGNGSEKKAEKKAETSSERAHRLGLPMKRCSEVLRELVKNPNSLWFRDPVDWVTLNIPDYPKIITKPMDFSTIQANIDASKYDHHDTFADHMRLVFKNAITFNQQPENAVHQAARELAAKFEDRFRTISSQLALAGYPSTTVAVPPVPPGVKKSSSSSSGAGSSRKSLGGKPSGTKEPAKGISRSSSTASVNGPRAPKSQAGSAAMDNTAHQIAEIHRTISIMQQEIADLRSQLREQEITRHLEAVQEAAHNPLTLEEKKALIEAIHKLPVHLMEGVLEIIQSALPDDNVDEIPLDTLDTYTMRKLQKFIEDNTKQKLRRNSTGGSKGERKPRKPRASALVKPDTTAGSAPSLGPQEDDAFLFSMEDMAQMPTAPAPAVSQSTSAPGLSEPAAGEPPKADEDLRRFRAGSIDEEFEDIVVTEAHSASDHAPSNSSWAAGGDWNSGP